MKFKIKRTLFNNYIILLLYIIVSGIVLLISDNPFVDIFSIILLAFGAAKIVKYDLSHPYVWYSVFFTLYSISYPILYLLNDTYDINIYTKNLMFSQWLALSIFLITISPKKINYGNLKELNISILTNKIIYILISLILFITIFRLTRFPYSNKNELFSSNDLIINIGFKVVLVFLVIYSIELSNFAVKNFKLDIKLTIYTFFVVFLMFLFSGERDLPLRVILITFYIDYILVKNKKNNKRTILIAIIALLLVPLLAKYKYYGVTKQITTSNDNIIISLLKSEFASASKNLQIVLLDSSSCSKFKGMTFVYDIARAFGLDEIFNLKKFSSLEWFNTTYFNFGRSGQGFTMVGEGYVNFGYIGIVLIFLIIGLLLRLIYQKSNKNLYFFVFYILSIPIFIYSIRADFASIISPLIKYNLLSILVIFLIEKMDKINK
ncbi:O-antigen polysaccharide polymerase Wzy [Sporanaerobacter sp. PP17-6a]|uniref:O-antigen polysaccharide polymerase Wzy n=1 Tax=Sporanaerobacter sp. PP17-6a TaxID=1891289 RepID=UPI00089F8FB9|nr:O-antigen polysaccharide polymerase Wzy [Sporanaerobacter sp. PP17-6a]SCL85416.1 hypothetical protein PP176A_0855 [Sporanaerobacter sp. PP17-6a]